MNEGQITTSTPRRYSGRLYLVLGLLSPFVGIGLYVFQMQRRVLIAPWYVPILATVGLLLAGVALMQARSIWRWGVAGLLALLAGGEWLMLLVMMSTPAYTGSARAGVAFPEFESKLANGAKFTQADLKGKQSTVLLFFRGRW